MRTALMSLVCATGFFGYLLVYAAVAHSGRYSARPWDALFETSTLGSASTPAAAGAGGSRHHQSVIGKILTVGGQINIWSGGRLP